MDSGKFVYLYHNTGISCFIIYCGSSVISDLSEISDCFFVILIAMNCIGMHPITGSAYRIAAAGEKREERIMERETAFTIQCSLLHRPEARRIKYIPNQRYGAALLTRIIGNV